MRPRQIVPLLLMVSMLLASWVSQSVAQTPTPTPGGDCCSVHGSTSCDVTACSECVCDIDPVCCVNPWDQFCVATAEDECLAECQCDRTPSPTPTPGGDCCSPHAGTGCDIGDCQACVCGEDSACCNLVWD